MIMKIIKMPHKTFYPVQYYTSAVVLLFFNLSIDIIHFMVLDIFSGE